MERLRKKAEELINLQNADFNDKIDDVKKLMHELQVYQIELELQNREMQEYSEKIKRAERKFFSLFNLAPIAYFLFDFKGVILDCNLKAAELLAYSKDILIRKPMISYIAEGKKDIFYNFIDDILKYNQQKHEEFTILNRDKITKIVEFDAILIQSEFILAAVLDITDKKKKDNELLAALQKAEQSDKLKSEFLNTISHEIRTPLNSIVGFSELICKPDLNTDKKLKYANNINISSQQLINKIDDILIISQITNKSLSKNESIFLLNQFLYDFENYVKKLYKNPEINFKITFPKEEIFIFTDKFKLENIFERILDNAFKFTLKGEINLSFEIKNKKIEFSFTDTGIGISKEKQQYLFTPFKQIESKQVFRTGLGLSLSIIKGYIDILEGEIWYETNLPEGSVFNIRLNHDINTKFDSKIDDKNIKIDITKKTILIAEDEQMNFELLAEIFSDFDVNIIHALNGKIAIDLLAKNNIDFILMDFKMPIMDGITATKIIRETNKKIKIIALTANIDSKNNDEINQLFDDFIFKPIDINSIIKKITKLLEN